MPWFGLGVPSKVPALTKLGSVVPGKGAPCLGSLVSWPLMGKGSARFFWELGLGPQQEEVMGGREPGQLPSMARAGPNSQSGYSHQSLLHMNVCRDGEGHLPAARGLTYFKSFIPSEVFTKYCYMHTPI